MELKILDVGCGPNTLSQDLFPYTELVRLDASEAVKPDVVHDITTPLPDNLISRFDLVFMSHVLEHIDRGKVENAVRNVSRALKNGGEIWIMVPSLEWVVERFDPFKGTDMVLHAMLYGGQQSEFDYHRCAFTLFDLRMIFDRVGLVTRRAYQTTFLLEDLSHDVAKECVQNVIIGMRNDPEPAILVA